MAKRPGSVVSPRGIAVLLILAVALGILAAVLAHPAAPTPTPPAPGASDLLAGPQVAVLVSLGILALLFGWLGWEAYVRLRDGRIGFPTVFLVIILAVLLLGLSFVVLFHIVSARIGPGSAAPGAPNSTARHGSGLPPGNVTQLPNGTVGPLPTSPAGPLGISWLDLGLLALAGSVAIGALLLVLYGRAAPPGAAEAPEVIPALRREIASVLDRMRTDPDPDPRQEIRELYRRLLAVLGPRIGPVAPYTPREIERLLVTEAAVSARPASELRELFEEARYSTHPMTSEHRDRARRALEGILADLEALGEPTGPRSGPERIGAPHRGEVGDERQ
ncbi:MAG: DUF4129 domain-containing protein [Thermoplasmata archaeon]